ncbi:MAG: TraU family protein [Thiotrichales bacterium]|nr:TraU family protein [Thiotrichales bacterium]
MKTLKIIFGSLLLLGASTQLAFSSATCNGKFPNPITDYCWSAVFPIKVAGFEIFNDPDQIDNDSSKNTSPVCTCGEGLDLKLGVSISFWEPITMVDVVRKPFCFAGLGGVDMGDVFPAPSHGSGVIDGGSVARDAFYQVHWYANPILFWLGALVDTSCLDRSPFDILDITEVNPLWNDEELTTLTVNPDAFLYANPLAQIACAQDCITASAGFPNNLTYWCAGCQGSMFPLTGKSQAHIGVVNTSSLLLQKFTNMGHRTLMIWGTSATDSGSKENGMCYKYPKFMMDKRDYKYSMLFPVPQRKIGGVCSQPFGRTTVLWGAGHAFPFEGEDVVYQVLRKRDCCEGANIVNGAM